MSDAWRIRSDAATWLAGGPPPQDRRAQAAAKAIVAKEKIYGRRNYGSGVMGVGPDENRRANTINRRAIGSALRAGYPDELSADELMSGGMSAGMALNTLNDDEFEMLPETAAGAVDWRIQQSQQYRRMLNGTQFGG